jgi:3-deoxy-manno-octulosonate cytidylyltransferase (CMP-KDO synthetase)
VIVATDDERIASVVRSAGKNVIMTSPDHPSGTDRCLEAMEKSGEQADAVINIQGDEPFVKVEQLNQLVEAMQDPNTEIATLAKRIEDPSWLTDPNKVKVVMNDLGEAMYFSRQAIPYVKGVEMDQWLAVQAYYKHLGLYAYKTAVLKRITQLEPSSLERAESLEQLRWLQNGYKIFVDVTLWETPAIDTPEDLMKVLASEKNSF